MRHVSRSHRVALDWLVDRINMEPKIQIKNVDTKNQLADIRSVFFRDDALAPRGASTPLRGVDSCSVLGECYPVSSGHHTSMEHSLRRKHLQLNSDSNGSKQQKRKNMKICFLMKK